ncbi:MAG: MetQ/NlpA family ABC transporter substrate-binding protein [Lachnospiraceae bacterium]
MTKRKIALTAVAALSISLLAGCGASSSQDGTTLKVGATPSPHAEILEQVADDLAEQGITLEIIEYSDYVQLNVALDSGDLDANYFQHLPYLESFNEGKGTDLISAGAIHYEPLGIYPGKTTSLESIQDGAQIAVPNDTTNEARALLLLQSQGLITLKEDAGLVATKNDIVENPKNLDIIEIEAAQIPKSIQDVDLAVLNGNYAIEAGLSAATDALVIESADSEAATTYANIIAVKSGNENNESIQALIKALQSEKIKTFIEDTYDGAVVPSF